MPSTDLPPELAAALDACCGRDRALVLAISGGGDSMALLHAVARWRPESRPLIHVATYDHGTGAAASDAVALVRAHCRALGLPLTRGRASRAVRTEAGWRAQRWRFLRRVARRYGARIVTAHTRDDQVETVLQRLMRGSGAWGLGALAVVSDVRRPWLGVCAHELRAWLTAAGVPWIEDPSNASPRHQRNRVRHELLPALRAVCPAVDAALLDVGVRAARWRAEVEAAVERLAPVRVAGGIRVAAAAVAEFDGDALAVLWPALAHRARVRLDRRGTRRLAQFTIRALAMGSPARAPLAGGAEVIFDGRDFRLRRRAAAPWRMERLGVAARHRGWRVRQVSPEEWRDGPADGWRAAFAAPVALQIRSWLPGDRIRGVGARPARRVTRYLVEAGVSAPERLGWPVVLVNDEVAWIVGVCRSDAATVRPGRPALHYVCDRSPC